MSNVIEFGKPLTGSQRPAEHMFSVFVYQDSQGMYEVSLEISENISDEQVFEAMMAATMKFATDHAITDEDEIELELE